MAFPRLNLLSWWLYVAGAILAVLALLTGGGAPDTGWTFYVPFSEVTSTNVSLSVFAVFVLGFSSILTGLNFIITMHRLRAPEGAAAITACCAPSRIGPSRYIAGDGGTFTVRHHSGAMLAV